LEGLLGVGGGVGAALCEESRTSSKRAPSESSESDPEKSPDKKVCKISGKLFAKKRRKSGAAVAKVAKVDGADDGFKDVSTLQPNLFKVSRRLLLLWAATIFQLWPVEGRLGRKLGSSPSVPG
jgi:hypothetical protein